MTTPLLTLVTDQARAILSLPELARDAVAGGVEMVQVREPGLHARTLELLVLQVVEAVGVDRVAVNNAPLLAAELGLHLHLPERSLAETSIPAGVESLSCSVHGTESLGQVPLRIDFVVAGHLFPTATHPVRPPLGVEGLKAIVKASRRPVVAIGGITSDNAGEAISGGAAGVAVMSYVNSSPEPRLAARGLRDALEQAMHAQTTAVTVQVNGKSMSIDPGTVLTSFLEERNLHPRLVVVERNQEIVAKSAYDSTILEEGDLLEIAHFVGGG